MFRGFKWLIVRVFLLCKSTKYFANGKEKYEKYG